VKPIGVELGQGGFGNAMFKYAHARALAERQGRQLQTTRWAGDRIFDLNDPPLSLDAEIIQGFRQHGSDIIYTKAQVRRWFKLQPEIQKLFDREPTLAIAAHLRWGDFVGHHGFIAISKHSYRVACDQYGLDEKMMVFVGEHRAPDFLPDFFKLWRAKVLLRGPSTFSWWAGTLGEHDRIFSPDQTGIAWQGGERIY
jgi:hypothetical protein